jgi:hypothetical protein
MDWSCPNPRTAVCPRRGPGYPRLAMVTVARHSGVHSLARQGRRILIAAEQLIAADPGRVLLTLPDLSEDVRESYPQPDGRWSAHPGALL